MQAGVITLPAKRVYMLLELNFTLVIFAISFLVFINLLNLTLYKPVGEIIEKRKGLVEGDLNKAKELSEEAQKSLDNYTSQMKQAKLTAQATIQSMVKDAEKIKQEKISSLLTTLSEEKEVSIKKIKEEEKKVMQKLEGEINILTDLITNKVLGKEKDLVGSR